MAKKDIDFDEELDKIARKSNVKLRKTQYLYDRQFKKLDQEIDNILDKKIKAFTDVVELRREYTGIDVDTSFVDRYREKLKKI